METSPSISMSQAPADTLPNPTTDTQPTDAEVAAAEERRVQARKTLDMFLNRFVDGYPYLCRATDISATGMRLRALTEPNRDQPLNPASPPRSRFMGLQFQLPGTNEVLTASAEAVFKDPERGEMGIRFTSLPRASREKLRRFLAP